MDVRKAAVSVTEMAHMVGLSRARFYDLVGTKFPHPVYDVASRRPFYPLELQEACMDVRRRNVGMDGKPALFYRQSPALAATPRRRKRKLGDPRHAELVAGLRSLGIRDASAAAVQAALKELAVADDQPRGELLRSVFLHLQRSNQPVASV